MSRKKVFNTKYSPNFKIAVIMDMREHHFSYRETIRKYWQTSSRAEEDLYKETVKRWECKYLEEGEQGLMTEYREQKSTGRPRKKPLDKEVENDLIAENQCLISDERATEQEKAQVVLELRQRFKLRLLLHILSCPVDVLLLS